MKTMVDVIKEYSMYARNCSDRINLVNRKMERI
jgi:hypothetical protein